MALNTSDRGRRLQRPGYRTVLVRNSSAGVGFYPLNAEQDFGEASHFADTPSPSLLKHLLKGEEGAAE